MAKNILKKEQQEQLRIAQQEGKEVAPEVLAVAILRMSEAMRVFNESRLSRKTVVALIHIQSGIARRDIEIVINNLEDLEKDWLKPLK